MNNNMHNNVNNKDDIIIVYNVLRGLRYFWTRDA